MAAAVNQNFTTYQGDYVVPIFTVYSDIAALTIQDISGVSEITWYARQNTSGAVLATKTKTGGDISFVTDGTDGKFQVVLDAITTLALEGDYLHYATITDVAAHVTTISVGRMQVGLKPQWTYNPAAIATVPLYQIRRLIGDVISDDPQLVDDEIIFWSTQYGSIYFAAAQCCRDIAAQYARKVNATTPGALVTSYASQTSAYAARANELERIGMRNGAGASQISAGGMSIAGKETVEADSDRVQPQFNIGMMDNLDAPVGPVGNETPSSPASQGDGW